MAVPRDSASGILPGVALIFISYRRADSEATVGRLHDHLQREFGAREVFKDVDSIPPGTDFRKVIAESVQACRVLIAVIGPQWLEARDGDGQRLIDDPEDFVRLEIERALLSGLHIIPVLVGSAKMPPPGSLPPGLEDLSFRSAIAVRPDPDFRRDIARLIKAISCRPGNAQPRRWMVGVSAGLLVGVLIAMRLLTGDSSKDLAQQPTPASVPTQAASTATPAINDARSTVEAGVDAARRTSTRADNAAALQKESSGGEAPLSHDLLAKKAGAESVEAVRPVAVAQPEQPPITLEDVNAKVNIVSSELDLALLGDAKSRLVSRWNGSGPAVLVDLTGHSDAGFPVSSGAWTYTATMSIMVKDRSDVACSRNLVTQGFKLSTGTIAESVISRRDLADQAHESLRRFLETKGRTC